MNAAAELEKMWQIFPVEVEAPISIRAIPPKGIPHSLYTTNITFNAVEFPNIESRQLKFTEAAIALNDQGYNIYTPFNPVKPSFGGDSTNRLAVSDSDIAYRRMLLIDLDRVETGDVPATDAEIKDAAAVAELISAYLLEEMGAVPWKVMSGNGIHLYVPLNQAPNDLESKTCSTPNDRNNSRFAVDPAVAMIFAPRAWAIWIAAMPTAPAPPWINIHSSR